MVAAIAATLHSTVPAVSACPDPSGIMNLLQSGGTDRCQGRFNRKAICRSPSTPSISIDGFTVKPLIELVALTGSPFIVGILVGYSLRSYVSIKRRLDRHL